MEFSDLEGHFPFPEMRSSQKLALEKFVSTTNKERKFTILELPTGVGKSGIAVTVGRHSHVLGHGKEPDGAYLLTIQKMLQKQYLDEFPELVEMKGAGNYRCNKYPQVNCDEGSKLSQALTDAPCDCVCPYKEARDQFMRTPFGVTNFAYFLTMSAYQPGLLGKRKTLIIDEAHNTESALINHSNIEITKARCGELGINFPSPPLGPQERKKAKAWLASVVFPACEQRREEVRKSLRDARNEGKEKAVSFLLKDEASLDQFQAKLQLFVDSESNLWFVGQSDKIEIKPLTGELFAEELLFSKADHVVLLSATILDPRTFVRNLGLSPKECGYIGVPSEFPKENRRIIFTPAGSMSYKNYDTTLPRLLKKMERIFNKHSEEKGIVHCQSFKTMKHILEYFRSSPHGARLLAHDSSPGSKQKAIAAHMTKDGPTILLSPSMTEGLDLRDHLSRFQVVAKMPFASLADPYVKTRMELDPAWYQWQTALTLIQGLGRSIRSKEDYAVSYIIDGDFGNFMTRAEAILPDWWLDSVEVR